MEYRITLLPGDGIGPEIMAVTVQFNLDFLFQEALIGGAAIDATGEPLPAETLEKCRHSDAVLLAAIGDYKWDNLHLYQHSETGLLGLRAGLGLFANLRPYPVHISKCQKSDKKRV